jgi:Fe-S cluster assembly protein SufD
MNDVIDFPVKPETRAYLDAFAVRGWLPREPDWLAGYRRRSLARFAELGFPSRRNEGWRYIDLRALEETPLLPAGAVHAVAGAATSGELDDIGVSGAACRLVLVDGRFAPEFSSIGQLPPGVWFGGMAEAIAERPELVRSAIEALPLDAAHPFAALNAAFFVDGFFLYVAPGIALDQPVEIAHQASGEAAGCSIHTRSLVAMGAGSRAAVFESFAGHGRYWRNDLVELQLAPGADFTRVALVEEATSALHTGEMVAALRKGARLASFALLLGGRTVRHEATVLADGEATHCGLNGAFLLSGRQEANVVTTVDHAAPGGETREVFKGVAAGHGHGAFQGRITVRPGAQKVDAHQLSRNLVLSPRAAIDTKPELEIFADDVKCSHGAAVGDLDETALFYLRTRGIGREEARRMLIEAFVREAVDLVELEPIREHLLSRLTRRLANLED